MTGSYGRRGQSLGLHDGDGSERIVAETPLVEPSRAALAPVARTDCQLMPTTAPEEELLTVPEVAMLLRCSGWTVRRRIHNGELPAYRTGGPGTPLRIKRSDLKAWLEQPKTGAAA
jgi:excisionase family DNA binding protein